MKIIQILWNKENYDIVHSALGIVSNRSGGFTGNYRGFKTSSLDNEHLYFHVKDKLIYKSKRSELRFKPLEDDHVFKLQPDSDKGIRIKQETAA